MNLNVIVCYCNKNGIGRSNNIPWKLSDDLKHFKFIKKNINNSNNDNIKNIVIMGRNTWESIPENFRPLKDRYNLVISSKKKFLDSDKVDYIGSSFENCLEYINHESNIFYNSKIFVIGGEMLYKYVLDNYSNSINKI